MAELISTIKQENDVDFDELKTFTANEWNNVLVFPHGAQSVKVTAWFASKNLKGLTPRNRMRFQAWKINQEAKKITMNTSFEKQAVATNATLVYTDTKIVLETATEKLETQNGPIPVTGLEYRRPGMPVLAACVCSMVESKNGKIVSNLTDIHNKIYASTETAFKPDGLDKVIPLIDHIFNPAPSTITQTEKIPKMRGLPFFDKMLTNIEQCRLSTYWSLHRVFIQSMMRGVTLTTTGFEIKRIKSGDAYKVLYTKEDFVVVPRTEKNSSEYDYFMTHIKSVPVLFVGTMPNVVSWRSEPTQNFDNLPLDTHSFETAWPKKKGLGLVMQWANFSPRQDDCLQRVNLLCLMSSGITNLAKNSKIKHVDIMAEQDEAILLLPRIHKRLSPFDASNVSYNILFSTKVNWTVPEYASYIKYERTPESIVVFIDDATLPSLQKNNLVVDERIRLQQSIWANFDKKKPAGRFVCYAHVLNTEVFAGDRFVYRLAMSPYAKGIISHGAGKLKMRVPSGDNYKYSSPMTAEEWCKHVYMSQRYVHTWFFSPKRVYNEIGMWITMDRVATYSYSIETGEITLPVLPFDIEPDYDEGEEDYAEEEEDFEDEDDEEDEMVPVLPIPAVPVESAAKDIKGAVVTTLGEIKAAPAPKPAPTHLPKGKQKRMIKVDEEAPPAKVSGDAYGGMFDG